MNSDELHESHSQPDPGDLQLLAFLRRHPQLRERVMGMTRRIEGEGGTLDAHRIEDLLVDDLRALGQAALGDWATAQEECCFERAKAGEGCVRTRKKLHWQSTLGRIEISERTLRRSVGGELVRPFCEAHSLSCRGHSLRLLRVMGDFGIEHSFAQAAARMREHYGVEGTAHAGRVLADAACTAVQRHLLFPISDSYFSPVEGWACGGVVAGATASGA